MFSFTYSYKGNIIQVTGTSGDYEGVWIIICQIGDDPVTIPLYSSYLMRDNPQNTISTTAIKKYNDFHSVRVEALEWSKVKKTRKENLLEYLQLEKESKVKY